MPTPPPAELAAQLVRADAALHAQVTVQQALAEQLVELRLSDHPSLSRAVIRLLPSRLARDVADDVIAHRELTTLKPSHPGPPIRLGAALAASRLRAYYTEAQLRSGVAWQVLAAVNYVESDFGRLREPSASGALGPMQFLPSTWAAYGRGDVHNPRAAILGALPISCARPAARATSAPRCIATTPRGGTSTPSSVTRAASGAIRRPFSSSTPAGCSFGPRTATGG